MTDKPRAKLLDLRIVELSGVDRPCHAPALVALMKRATDDESTPALIAQDSTASKSTRSAAPTKVATMTLEEALAEIADLKAKLAELDKSKDDAEARAAMTDAEKAHLAKLHASDAKAFLAKSASERGAVIAKALADDPVEVEFNGQQVRKSAGPAMVELAKAAKATADKLAARDAEIAKAEVTEIAKSTMGNFPGADDVREYVIKSIRSGGGDATVVDAALKALKGADAELLIKRKPAGSTGEAPNGATASVKLDALVEKHAADNKVSLVKARAAVLATSEGLALYAESERSKK